MSTLPLHTIHFFSYWVIAFSYISVIFFSYQQKQRPSCIRTSCCCSNVVCSLKYTAHVAAEQQTPAQMNPNWDGFQLRSNQSSRPCRVRERACRVVLCRTKRVVQFDVQTEACNCSTLYFCWRLRAYTKKHLPWWINWKIIPPSLLAIVWLLLANCSTQHASRRQSARDETLIWLDLCWHNANVDYYYVCIHIPLLCGIIHLIASDNRGRRFSRRSRCRKSGWEIPHMLRNVCAICATLQLIAG